MHRISCIALLWLGVILPSLGPATAPALAAEVGFDPPLLRTDDLICADATLVVRLVVTGQVERMQGFSIAFQFDPEVIAVEDVRAGNVLTDQQAPTFFYPWERHFAAGLVQIDAAVLGTTCAVPSPDGGNVLAEIRFHKLGCTGKLSCATNLDLELIDVRNNENRGIEMSGDEGTVLIRPCILPVEHVSWGRLKALYYE